MSKKSYEDVAESLRPASGDRVVRAADTASETRGTVLACVDARRSVWAALVEWDEGTSRRSPEALEPTDIIVGLVKVEGR